jgi:hypothetical protein
MISQLIKQLSDSFSTFTDNRKPSPNKTYAIQDVVMSAFSVFFFQSPSFLEHQRRFERMNNQNNGRSLFGITSLPSDNQIRKLVDDVDPQECEASFLAVCNAVLDQHKSTFQWTRPDQQKGLIVPLDGSEFFSSKSIHCPCCLTKEHRPSDKKEEGGKIVTHYSHAMVCPIIAHPESSFVLPLMPEFIQNEDGAIKQDCEIKASKRWIDKNKAWLTENKVTFLGDDLYSRSPFCKIIQSLKDVDFIFTCKSTSHSYLANWLKDFDDEEWQTVNTTETKGNKKRIYRYKFVNQVPLCGEKDAPSVNYFEMIVTDSKGKTLYRNAYVTSHTLSAANIHEVACVGRSRWKIENEAFNILKNNGYHFEHNFGHGKKHLSNMLACLNLLAFLVHSAAHFLDEAYRILREKLPAKKYLFEILGYAVQFLLFDDWPKLMGYLSNNFLKNPK